MCHCLKLPYFLACTCWNVRCSLTERFRCCDLSAGGSRERYDDGPSMPPSPTHVSSRPPRVFNVLVCLCVCLQTWLWVSAPLCFYCAERLYRYIRSCDPVTIVTVVRHPCDVFELRMLKKNFRARPGQVFMRTHPILFRLKVHQCFTVLSLHVPRLKSSFSSLLSVTLPPPSLSVYCS